MRIIFLIFFLFSLPGFLFAQQRTNDSLAVAPVDTLTDQANRRANKAAIFSAIIPGAGQVYNKSYWKVPVLYAGVAALIYFIDFNQDYYRTFKSAYLYRSDQDSTTIDEFPNYTSDDLLVRKDYYRRNRDLCYILAGVVYVLNIIDAYVDAHLRDFDVSDDLTLHAIPYIDMIPNGAPVTGLTLSLKFTK